MSKDIIQRLKDRMKEVNDEQSAIREKKGNISPEFVAHATHVSQDEFRASVPDVYSKLSGDIEIVPAFPKATQNELNAFKDFLPSLSKEEAEELRGYITFEIF